MLGALIWAALPGCEGPELRVADIGVGAVEAHPRLAGLIEHRHEVRVDDLDVVEAFEVGAGVGMS